MSLLRCGPPLGSVFTCFHCFFGDVGLQTRILGVFPGILQAMFSAFHVFGSATWLVAAAACRCDGALAGLGWNWTWEAESFFLHSTTVQPWYSSSVSMQAWYSFIDFLIWCNIFLQNLCVNMLIGPSKHHHASEATCPDVSYLRQIWSIRLV